MTLVKFSIIILGRWNPGIFTPFWIKSNLLELEDKEMQALFNFDDLEFAFGNDNITLVPKSSSFEIIVENFDNISGQKAATILIKLLTLLPQTPIKAIGVNFRYAVKKTEKTELINSLNDINFSFKNFKLNQIKQTMNNKNYITNIVSQIQNTSYLININFHYSKIIEFDTQFINEHFIETQNILKNGK